MARDTFRTHPIGDFANFALHFGDLFIRDRIGSVPSLSLFQLIHHLFIVFRGRETCFLCFDFIRSSIGESLKKIPEYSEYTRKAKNGEEVESIVSNVRREDLTKGDNNSTTARLQSLLYVLHSLDHTFAFLSTPDSICFLALHWASTRDLIGLMISSTIPLATLR